ncbi:hypothetical protein TrLO_g4063 [Triparma laevis f. longispina]|uniref:S phase cyclin A-associated protein in the endoplasmic reticulum N-terminal domain-containing protein n=1 Tax=Triparma laevis f. longispina TaxID=1714387 RepID=A0A9W7B420_9STRA|nr:hypothetical protein TrLO_g4063 [Triparma laevis f. longispina]
MLVVAAGPPQDDNDADVEDSTICSSSTFAASTTASEHNSLFPHLLSRLSLAINEIYYHCEATVEADQLGYVDRVKEVLWRGGDDFDQLHQRILVQREHDEPTQIPKLHKGGLSWEVRKTNASKEQSSVIRSSIERMERDAKEQREAKAETDTDNDATPQAERGEEKALPSDNAWISVEEESEDETNSNKPPSNLQITGKSIVIPSVYVDNNGNPLPSNIGSTTKASIPLSPNNDSEYPETDNETKDAIESVWKEAEQWVDNITMAEEAAWREIDRKNSQSQPPTPLSVNTNPEMLQSDVEQSPLHYNDDSSSATGLTPQKNQRKNHSPLRNRNESWYSSSEDEDETKIKPKPSSLRTPNQTSSYNLTPLSMGSASSTTSSSRFNTPSYATSHYSLHDKLSSPDRRRPSPAETEARLKERTEKAALRRKERDDATKLKLAKAAERIEKARNSVELKSQEAAASLNEKMKQAEEQAERHRLSIVKKAESENMKVEEISFINALTEKDFEEQLSHKLLETNSRINAARERRRAAQQRKSSTNESRRMKSSKVMSKRELEREQQQQERWEKLQAKIKAVSERRAARMKELVEIKKAKEDKMEEAKKKRGELEDEVVKRSAEKEQRRFNAEARRSSGGLDESSPSKSDGERASLEALEELVTVQGPPSRPRQKTVSAEGEDEIFGSAGVPAPNQPANPSSMKLLSMLDVDQEKLSREEKKKRRKRLGSVRKKLREDVDLCEGVDGDGGEKVSAAVSNLSAAVNALPQPADGISVDAAAVQSLENEVNRLGKALANENSTSGLKSAVAVLIQCYKVVSGLTGRLVFDRTCGVIVSVITKLVVDKKESGIVILGCPDGPTAIVDGAVKCLCNEWIGTEEDREGSNGDAVKLVEVLLKAEAEKPYTTTSMSRKTDLVRYIVLTPLCEILSCVLRSFKLPSSRESLIAKVLLPLIETLAEGDGEEGVVSLASFWRVEVDKLHLKDLMLEKVGGGLISLVASVLPDTSNPNSSFTNANGVPLSVLCLQCLCLISQMDVKRFQLLCKGEVASGWEGGGGYLEFNYVANVILSAPLNSGEIEECLKWCIILLGYFVVCNPINQQRLHWGGDNLLGKLSSLPFQYFCDSQKKEILFPTLILACHENDTNKKAVEDDLNPELLACFLRDKLRLVEAEDSDKVGEDWAKAVACSKRVPKDLWNPAAEFFNE